jgi:hypothetical protein
VHHHLLLQSGFALYAAVAFALFWLLFDEKKWGAAILLGLLWPAMLGCIVLMAITGGFSLLRNPNYDKSLK